MISGPSEFAGRPSPLIWVTPTAGVSTDPKSLPIPLETAFHEGPGA